MRKLVRHRKRGMQGLLQERLQRSSVRAKRKRRLYKEKHKSKPRSRRRRYSRRRRKRGLNYVV